MANKQRETDGMMRVSPPLLEELRRMIEESRRSLAAAVNAAMTMLNWRLGKQIDATLSQQLSWSHFCELMRNFYAEMYRVERWRAQGSARSIGNLLKEVK